MKTNKSTILSIAFMGILAMASVEIQAAETPFAIENPVMDNVQLKAINSNIESAYFMDSLASHIIVDTDGNSGCNDGCTHNTSCR